MAEIWVVDDDRSLRRVLEHALSGAGHRVRCFPSAPEALAALPDGVPAMLFTDIRMDVMDGLELLDHLAQQVPELPVVVMSAYADLSDTVRAYATGAFEFLPKPFDLDQAIALADRAGPSASAPAQPATAPVGEELIGETAPMREVFRAIGRLARAELPVLITGETGTGKELVARALHRHSPRAGGPFVALNTAAIPSELLESELFGHEQGAFTGAQRRNLGRFEQAHGGTLFLDEIGDMPAALQTRLLRVLAEGEFYRVGGRELIRVDVRVIAATHRDLEQRVASGQFRADLLHRLDVVRIHLPALAERRADIPLLAERFLAEAAAAMGLERKRLSSAALERLSALPFPGNVRQLENLCRRLAVMAPGREILVSDLPAADLAGGTDASEDWIAGLRTWLRRALAEGREGLLPEARARLETALLEEALASTGGHRQEAARLLGLGRNTVTRKLARGGD